MGYFKDRPYHLLLGLSISTTVMFLLYKEWIIVFVGGGIVITSLLIRPFAKGLEWLLNTVTVGIGKIVSLLVLSLIYFLFLVPISLFYRLFSKEDHLLLKNSRSSTFKTSEQEINKDFFEKPW